MSFLASSSRLPAASFSSLSPSLTFIRTKKTDGSARYAKTHTPYQLIQKPKEIHDPRLPLTSSGAQEPHPPNLTSHVPVKSSVALDDTWLRLHHSPPSSAPSYTFGQIPTLLRWLGGETVNLTGEEAAPYINKHEAVKMKGTTPEMPLGSGREWSDQVKSRIRKLRKQGKSINQVAGALGIPEHQRKIIPYIATATPKTLARQAEKLESLKSTWGWNKRMEREIRIRRRAFW